MRGTHEEEQPVQRTLFYHAGRVASRGHKKTLMLVQHEGILVERMCLAGVFFSGGSKPDQTYARQQKSVAAGFRHGGNCR